MEAEHQRQGVGDRRQPEASARSHAWDNESQTDPLTGVGNRRAFDQAVAALPAGGGVLLLDLDGFKSVNDSLGHAAGDQVLASFGRMLRASVRAGSVTRIGGDEFAVVLEQDGAIAAAAVVARLATAWQSPHGVSYSHGFGLHVDGSPPPGTAIARADRELYRAKEARRAAVLCAAEQRPESPVRDLAG